MTAVLVNQEKLLANMAMQDMATRFRALEEAAAICDAMASGAYVQACEMAKSDLCLGEEAKISTGKFTVDNLKALEAVRAKFGAHYAYAEAARRIRAMQ